jgi:hypothetical protein
MPTTGTAKVDGERDTDAREAYATLQTAEERKAGGCGALVKLAKAYPAKYAEKSVRREIGNFISLRATADNLNWANTLSFVECLNRLIHSDIQHDPRRKDEYLDGEKRAAYERDTEMRFAFKAAVASGATDEVVKHALALAKGKRDASDAQQR